jgi:hypothetical protein
MVSDVVSSSVNALSQTVIGRDLYAPLYWGLQATWVLPVVYESGERVVEWYHRYSRVFLIVADTKKALTKEVADYAKQFFPKGAPCDEIAHHLVSLLTPYIKAQVEAELKRAFNT